jgi:membrane protease YdiL (CAAX protease family)
MEAKQITVRTLAISVLGVLSLEFLLRWTIPSHSLIVLGMIRVLQATLVALAARVWDRGLASLGMDPSALLPGFKRGLLWAAGFALLCCVLFSVLLLVHLNPLKFLQARLPRKPMDLLLFFLVGGVIAPLAEEIFFRGLIYGFLRRWGFPAALVLSTLFFVLVHPMDRSLPVTQIIGGLLFAVAYEVEGNLLVPITIHALGNLAIFTTYLLMK